MGAMMQTIYPLTPVVFRRGSVDDDARKYRSRESEFKSLCDKHGFIKEQYLQMLHGLDSLISFTIDYQDSLITVCAQFKKPEMFFQLLGDSVPRECFAYKQHQHCK